MVVPYQLHTNSAAIVVSAQEVAAAAAPRHIVLQQGRASCSQHNDIVAPCQATDRQTDRQTDRKTLIRVGLGNLKWFLQVNILLSELITLLTRMSYISWPLSSFLWPSTSLIGLLCFASFCLAIQTQKTSHSVSESDPSTASVSSIDPYPMTQPFHQSHQHTVTVCLWCVPCCGRAGRLWQAVADFRTLKNFLHSLRGRSLTTINSEIIVCLGIESMENLI